MLADLPLFRPTPQATESDCFPAAVASILGLSIDELPSGAPAGTVAGAPVDDSILEAHWKRWIGWADSEGYVISWHDTTPVEHDGPWIGFVANRACGEHSEPGHAVVMLGDAMLWDPNQRPDAPPASQYILHGGWTIDRSHSSGTPVSVTPWGRGTPPKTLPGAVWTAVSGSDADDFILSSTLPGLIERTSVFDADLNTGRYLSAGTTSYAAITVRGLCLTNYDGSADIARIGVFARLVDINNWVMAVRCNVPRTTQFGVDYRPGIAVYKRVSGTVTRLGYRAVPSMQLRSPGIPELSITADGRWTANLHDGYFSSDPLAATFSGSDPDLATGGTLASGKIGIYDAYVSPGLTTGRVFFNFEAFVPPTHDAAVYASQSIEVRHDRVIREDASGAFWSSASDYQGDYLKIPVAGKEGRQVRVIVKASRNTPDSTDTGIDDISARLTITPRYLQLPDA